jgi:hypothetical protein
VDGGGKKFCRSVKKSLWYGVCDIGAELNPFRRRVAEVAGSELRVAGEEEAVTGRELLVASENTSDAGASGLVTSHSPLVTPTPDHAARDEDLREGEFYAVRDVSFELRRGELRNPGRSEKEISKKCLGATKVPDSGRRRHQCLGLIGHNGAGNQAAGQLLGRLPQVARRVRRRGKARINTTLLKMLNGLIKPDRGTITMRGRVGALIALGAGFNPILTT